MSVDIATLEATIERLAGSDPGYDIEEARTAAKQLLEALTRGEVRSARKIDGEWRAVEWVKRGILLAFRVGKTREVPSGGAGVAGQRGAGSAQRQECNDEHGRGDHTQGGVAEDPVAPGDPCPFSLFCLLLGALGAFGSAH